MRFGKNDKLSLRFIGPYEVIEEVGPIVYRLSLPPNLEKIHNVFHVSIENVLIRPITRSLFKEN